MTDIRPFFSVIVPTYRRPEQLVACLQALAAQEYPRERFEVVVAEDGGGTALGDVVDGVRDRVDVTLLELRHGGPGAARNAAVERARGDVLAFTDDDCAPAPDWLRRLAAHFDADAAAIRPTMVGGRTLNALPHNAYSTASQMVVDVGYAHLNADPDDAGFFQSCNMAMPASGFHEVGGFDVTLVNSEDRELCARWRQHGHRLVYDRDVIVHHAHVLGASSFLRQHYEYGRGSFQLQRIRTRHGWEQFRPDPGYYRRLLAWPASRQRSLRAVPLTALLVAAQAVNTLGFAAEWLRARRARVRDAAISGERR
jgi:GT2 family glycosyltransferase